MTIFTGVIAITKTYLIKKRALALRCIGIVRPHLGEKTGLGIIDCVRSNFTQSIQQLSQFESFFTLWTLINEKSRDLLLFEYLNQ